MIRSFGTVLSFLFLTIKISFSDTFSDVLVMMRAFTPYQMFLESFLLVSKYASKQTSLQRRFKVTA